MRGTFLTGHVCALFLVICLLGGSPARGQDSEGNPFKHLLNSENYRKRLEALMPRFEEILEEAKSECPELGIQATGVLPGSLADRSGVIEGDVITRVDGRGMWDRLAPLTDEDTQFEFFNPQKGLVTAEAEPGKYGIYNQLYERPDLFYLRNSEQRNPEWDCEVTMGIHLRETDPLLAESAWYHAFEKGYQPDLLSHYMLLEFGYLRQERDPEIPGEFLKQIAAAERKNPGTSRALLPAISKSLLSCGSMQIMEQLKTAYPELPWTDGEIAKLKSFIGSGIPGGEKTLLERATALRGELVTKQIISTMKPHEEKRVAPFAFLRGRTINVGVGKYWQGEGTFREGKLKNFHLQSWVRMRRKHNETPFSNAFRLEIIEAGKGPFARSERYKHTGYPGSMQLLKMVLHSSEKFPETKMELSSSSVEPVLTYLRFPFFVPKAPHEEEGGNESESDPLAGLDKPRPKEADPFKIDIIRLENEVGLYVNEYCYIHMPCDSAVESVRILCHASGMDIAFGSFDVWALNLAE